MQSCPTTLLHIMSKKMSGMAKTRLEPTRTYFGGRAGLIKFSLHEEGRGTLLPLYFDTMPFQPCRTFAVSDVPAGTTRGGHSHRDGWQLLICLNGRIDVLMRYGSAKVSISLAQPSLGVTIGAGVWSQQTYMTAGSVLLVFASEPYDSKSYDNSDPSLPFQ